MGNSASALPYSIGKVAVQSVNDGWVLHEGNRKSDNATVSVFVAKKPALTKTPVNAASNPHMTQLNPALHHFQHCKKLRHPHILKVYATLDTDHPTDSSNTSSSGGGGPGNGAGGPASGGAPNAAAGGSAATETGDLIIVTEPCKPLDTWLGSNPPPEQVAWGLEAIVRALHFMHASASLAHGNVHPSSFFVTPAGDVKLWNFSIVSKVSDNVPLHFRDYECLTSPLAYRSPERQEGRWEAISVAGVHAMDSYSLGLLIGHFFGGRVPPQLVKAVQRLQTPNIKMRPRLQPLLKCPVFDTPYQKLQLQLEEFTVQAVEQKVAFWQNLTPSLQAGLIPTQLAVFKLLPLMKTSIQTICQSDSLRTQDLYRREVLSILPPMFFIAEHHLEGENVAKELTAVITILFQMNDRGIRGSLLQKANLLASHMEKNTLNSAVFEPMCSGFADSSAPLRELTLKATAVLVPHLTEPNIEKLSRYLVRLQGDAEPSIRTNTVIFFTKLARYLTAASRQKLLLPAFCRAMKDPFTPCRLAALQSTLKSKDFFDAAGIAGKVLPAVTPQLLDVDPRVRKEAFAVVDDFIFLLRQESQRMASEPTASQGGAAGAATNTTAGGAAPAGAAPAPAAAAAPAPASGGGYFSWMSGSITKTTSAPVPAAPPAPVPVPVAAAPQQTTTTMPYMAGLSMNTAMAPTPQPLAAPSGMMMNTTMAVQAAPPPPAAADGWDDDGGWSDHDDMDDVGNTTAPTPAMQPSSAAAAAPAAAAATGQSMFAAGQKEEDFFGSFDAMPAKPAVGMRGASAGGRLTVPGKRTAAANKAQAAAAPAVTKLDAKDDDIDDGWDDF